MAIPSLRRQFLIDNLDLSAATGVEWARWEPFQIAHLDDNSPFRIENKSRQIAWSWLTAAEAIAEAVLDGQSSLFVSINLDEATEKIRYARQIYESLRVKLPKITMDNRLALEFENGSRLVSSPAKPPRGKSRLNVYLDEFAHVRDAQHIYTAAIPVISKGGRMRIGSSPYGASGIFWEIFTNYGHKYSYTNKITPWWKTFAFCTDVKLALTLSKTLTPTEMVVRFGNSRLKTIFDNMLLEDFLQEFNCQFVDESTAWITWEEIRSIEQPIHVWERAAIEGKEIGSCLEAIDRLSLKVGKSVETVFACGFDIGRKRNASEIFLVGISPSEIYPLRLAITMHNTPYDEQLEVTRYLLESLPVVRLNIDNTGIGNNIAEALEKLYPSKVFGMTFTAPSKVLWATNTKMLVQQGKPLIPVDREFARQVHSIKRRLTANTVVFDSESTDKSHADKFWAWTLALNAAYVKADDGEQIVVRSRKR